MEDNKLSVSAPSVSASSESAPSVSASSESASSESASSESASSELAPSVSASSVSASSESAPLKDVFILRDTFNKNIEMKKFLLNAAKEETIITVKVEGKIISGRPFFDGTFDITENMITLNILVTNGINYDFTGGSTHYIFIENIEYAYQYKLSDDEIFDNVGLPI